MGLVDYSDSECSDTEATAVASAAAPAKPSQPGAIPTVSKKPAFQKLVSHTGSGGSKIIVNLPGIAAGSPSVSGDEPPTKRARTAATLGTSRFSNLGSFLPPPKKRAAAPAASNAPARGHTDGGSAGPQAKNPAPRPGVHLKTGAEPSFSRTAEMDDGDDGLGAASGSGLHSGLSLPPPKAAGAGGAGKSDGPSIPEGMKPADEVKLVGKPLMFRPLSVARKPGANGKAKKKKTVEGGLGPPEGASLPTKTAGTSPAAGPASKENPETGAPKRHMSLFAAEEENVASSFRDPSTGEDGIYEPFSVDMAQGYGYNKADSRQTHEATRHAQYQDQDQLQGQQPAQQAQTLASLADDLNLTPAARRELFGRGAGDARSNKSAEAAAQAVAAAEARFVNFNMEREYAHNERLRASGEQVAHNPLRSIAPGKHSLRQMVNMVQGNEAALEEHFASGRANQQSAAARYGWK